MKVLICEDNKAKAVERTGLENFSEVLPKKYQKINLYRPATLDELKITSGEVKYVQAGCAHPCMSEIWIYEGSWLDTHFLYCEKCVKEINFRNKSIEKFFWQEAKEIINIAV